MNRKKLNIIILIVQLLLFIGILVLSNDKVSDALPFNAVPYLYMVMLLNQIASFMINKNDEKDVKD